MPENILKVEADLRTAAMDRLIAASLRYGKPALEETLEHWRRVGIQAQGNAAARSNQSEADAFVKGKTGAASYR